LDVHTCDTAHHEPFLKLCSCWILSEEV